MILPRCSLGGTYSSAGKSFPGKIPNIDNVHNYDYHIVTNGDNV